MTLRIPFGLIVSLCLLGYFLAAMATGVHHAKGCAEDPHYGLSCGERSVVSGFFWPFYWTYRATWEVVP